jgi:hypothetical protein
MDSPASPQRRFPFHAHADPSPKSLPDCHLVRTAIPYSSVTDSLGAFHRGITGHYPLLQAVFQKDIAPAPRPWDQAHCSSIPTCPRKAGYAAHSVPGKCRDSPRCRFNPVPYRSRLKPRWEYAPAQYPVSTAAGLQFLMPLRAALTPQATSAFLQHPPQTGRKKQTPEGSQMCPLKDF